MPHLMLKDVVPIVPDTPEIAIYLPNDLTLTLCFLFTATILCILSGVLFVLLRRAHTDILDRERKLKQAYERQQHEIEEFRRCIHYYHSLYQQAANAPTSPIPPPPPEGPPDPATPLNSIPFV